VRQHIYEITFAGPAGPTLRAMFDDCDITDGPDTTILTASLPDQAALAELVQRITSLRLDIIRVQRQEPSPPRGSNR
jgi:hypothetical protein